MSLTVLTPEEWAQKNYAALKSRYTGTDALVDENNLAVEAKVRGMVDNALDQRRDWTYRQQFAFSCDKDELPRHGKEVGILQGAASRASGSVTLTGATPSTAYPAGLNFLFGSAAYISTAGATSDSAGNLTVTVIAADPGADGNRAAGDTLTFVDTGDYPELDDAATVAVGGIGGGADAEDPEAWRLRILDKKRNPPQGNSLDRYEQLALSVSGVLKAWALQIAPGYATIWVLNGNRANYIPTSADVATVQAAFDTKRWMGVQTVVAPVAQTIDITIADLADDTAQTRAAIADGLAAMFLRRARPGLPDGSTVFSRSWIGEAISKAAGEDSHVLTVPSTDVAVAAGHYPVPGTIAYV
jgi:uncharacterized phage protein gp47/JayE